MWDDYINVAGGIMHPGARTENSKLVLRNRQVGDEERQKFFNVLMKALLDH